MLALREKSRVLFLLFLAATVLAVFGQVGSFPFVSLDDPDYVTGNRNVLQGLSVNGIHWAFTTFHAANWHPVTWVSHAMDVEFFGTNAGAHHLVNVMFHLLNASLLFLFLSHVTGAPWKSAIVTAVFALHPLRVESVAWVSERKDLLCAMFWILSIWSYARYVERPGWPRYLVVLFCFALGLMSKPMAVTLPFVLILLDYWPFGRMGGSRSSVGGVGRENFRFGLVHSVAEKTPLFLLSAAVSLVTYAAQQRGGAVVRDGMIPFGLRLGNAVTSYVGYISKTFWPSSLTFYYPFPFGGVPSWKVGGSAVLLLLITALAGMNWKRRPYILFGWLWFIGTMIPVIGLIQVGNHAMADRYTYIPSIGLLIAAVWGAGDLLGRTGLGKMAPALAVILVFALGIGAWRQVGYWKDEYSLATRGLQVTRGNWKAWQTLGIHFASTKEYDKAIEAFREAIRMRPDLAEQWFNLGISYVETEKYAQAVEAFRLATRLKPDFAEAWNNLGIAYQGLGEEQSAVGAFETAVRESPDHYKAVNNLAISYIRLGRHKEAVAGLKTLLSREPGYATAWHNLGVAYKELGMEKEVLDVYMQLSRLDNAAAGRFRAQVMENNR